MSKTKFFITYIVFLIGALLYGSLFVAGFLTLRHIVTIIMFAVCLIETKPMYSDIFQKIFMLFVVCFFFSSFLSGFVAEGMRRIIGYYFVSYVGVYSTMILITKYHGEKVFFYTICIIGLFDAIATFGQLTLSSTINQVVSALRLDLAIDDDFESLQESKRFGLGYNMPGIMGIVASSYFLMTASILSLVLQIKRINIIGLAITVTLLTACFVVQERSSFYLALAFVVFLLILISMKRTKQSTRLFSLFIVVFGICALYIYGLNWIGSFGTRVTELDSMTGRDEIWDNTLEYLGNYPFFAGYDRMMQIYHKDAHNLIINAYVFGGLFGFFAIIVLLVKQFSLITAVCIKNFRCINPIILILACSYVAYTINGLVHNHSIVYGTLDVWLLWAAFYGISKREIPVCH